MDDNTVRLCGTDGHALMACSVETIHNLPEGQTFVVPDVPSRVPTATQCKEPWPVELEPWTAAVEPRMLERVLDKFEEDARTGAFNPELGERCLRAIRYCGPTYVEQSVHRQITRFSTFNSWGPSPLVVLLAGVRLTTHLKEAETNEA